MSLTDADLAAARVPFMDWLDATARIHRYSSASDGGGGYTAVWTPDADTLPARVAPLGMGGSGGGERTPAGDRTDDQGTVVITLPAETALTDADRIDVDGTMYEITNIRLRSRELSRRVEARQVP